MKMIVACILVLLFPSVAQAPTAWSLSWPQTIMETYSVKYVMSEPGGEVVKYEKLWAGNVLVM